MQVLTLPVASFSQITGAESAFGLSMYVALSTSAVPVAVIIPPATVTDAMAPLALGAAGIPHFSCTKLAAVVHPVAPVCIAISIAIL